MLARILLAVYLIELGLYAVFGYLLVAKSGWTLTATVLLFVGVALLVRALIVAVSFFRSAGYRGAAPVDTSLGLMETLRLWRGEYLGMLRGFGLNALLGPGRDANRVRAETRAGELPVLFVHGYLCNAGFWRPMIRRFARTDPRPMFTIDLEPLLGSIDDLAELLTRRIDEVLGETGKRQLVLVAHSMGGLVCRRALRDPNTAAKVRGLCTLGTPHHGTVLAISALGENGRQMRPGSNWLLQLNAQSGTLPVRTVSFYSYHDNIVAPQISSLLPGAENVALAGLGHITMYCSERIRRLLAAELDKSSGSAKKHNEHGVAKNA